MATIKPGKTKTLTHTQRISSIIKLILVLLSLCSSGCAVLSPATDSLKKSNKDYISRNERTVDIDYNYKPNSSIKADYLGKQNGAYFYSGLGPNNKKVYFKLPDKKTYGNVIISRDQQIAAEMNKKTAMFHFFDDKTDYPMLENKLGKDKIISEERNDYPENIYIGNMYYYFCNGNSIYHSSKLQTELSGFDTLLLGVRSLGYFITVPIDTALTLAYAPFSLFIPRCGIWGCP